MYCGLSIPYILPHGPLPPQMSLPNPPSPGRLPEGDRFVIDEVSGEILYSGDSHCPRCDANRLRAENYQADMHNLERQRTADLRRIARLEKQLSEQTIDDPKMDVIKRIFHYWVRTTNRDPKRTKLGQKRIQVVSARLGDGYKESEITTAVDGLLTSDYHTKNGHTDLTFVCRDEATLEKWRDVGEAVKKDWQE